jgi:hypothetical protein
MKFQLSIQTLTTTGVGVLKKAKPDNRGYYRGVPLTVIGAVSRNNYYYDPDSLVESMKNPNTRFHKSLVTGGLNGEWGHPDVTHLSENAALHRMADVMEQKVSHFFNRIWIDTLENGVQIVRGDVKPFGPYGEYLRESFEDPDHETGFSLRSLTSDPLRRPDGSFFKKVLAMITYDGVSVPGYEMASKRAMIGTESLGVISEDVSFKLIDTVNAGIPSIYDVIGYESFNCQQVLDILETDKVNVSITSKNVGVFDSATGTFMDASGRFRRKSVLHNLIGS